MDSIMISSSSINELGQTWKSNEMHRITHDMNCDEWSSYSTVAAVERNHRSKESRNTKKINEKRKMSYKDSEYKRLLTNSRERVRQQSLNSAFQLLREIVPKYPEDAKLSKYCILKSAIWYITFLRDLLADMDEK